MDDVDEVVNDCCFGDDGLDGVDGDGDETVDGADGFDGCGWRLMNHLNFMQCLSFCNKTKPWHKHSKYTEIWQSYVASFGVCQTCAPFSFTPTAFTWSRVFECLAFSLFKKKKKVRLYNSQILSLSE